MEKLDKKNIADVLALTPMQEGMLFHYLKNPESNHYFEQLSLGISGEIKEEFFEKAWNFVIETNEMLRTVFRWEKLEKSMQIILKEHKCKVIFYDLSKKDSSRKKTALEEIKNKDRLETFDLHQVPFRVILIKIEEKKYQVVISNHHILYDGWSNGIILKEFFKAYHELCKGEQSIKPFIKPPFKDFIKWIQSQDRNKQELFWREYLDGFGTPTVLPVKRRRDRYEVKRVESYSLILEEDIKNKLDVFVTINRVTLASVLYCAWGILLQKYCSSDDVVFGTTVAGRSSSIKGIEDMVGLFINTIPIRIQAHPNEKINTLLSGIDRILQEREEFESTPLVDIKGYSEVENNSELFDSIVVLENYPLDRGLMREISKKSPMPLVVDSYSIFEATTYDLTVGITIGEDIEINFGYLEELFENAAIRRLSRHFINIMENILKNDERDIPALEILSEKEKKQILVDFNAARADYPKDKSLAQLFAEQAARTPDRTAVIGLVPSATDGSTQTLTYRELNQKCRCLAWKLVETGVTGDTIVGLMVGRSVEMIIGILGILKAGAAYLPIEPDYPPERIDYMLKDSNVRVLVTTPKLQVKAEVKASPGQPWLPLQFITIKADPAVASEPSLSTLTSTSTCRVSPTNLAYIIYTSGSTGEPKGSLVEHRNMNNLLSGYSHGVFRHYSGVHRGGLVAPYVFDASMKQIFCTLLPGHTLVISPEEARKDIGRLMDFYIKYQIDFSDGTPTHIRLFLENPGSKISSLPVKHFLIGGEVLPPQAAADFLDGFQSHTPRITNVYGPTECCVETTWFEVTPGNSKTLDRIPIGKPMANQQVYIMDSQLRLQGVGLVGEVCISGNNVGRGYLNHPELTAEKFVNSKFQDPKYRSYRSYRSYKSYKSYISKKLYKTGDLGRWLADGNIELLGRKDFQVKIRGFRIELGEIEKQLLKHERIKEAVVIDRVMTDGDKYLCAYIVGVNGNAGNPGKLPGSSDLRTYLSQTLPDYMIPSFFIPLDKIPINTNDKVDRKALPEPGIKAGDNYAPPRNETEKRLVDIWSEILEIEKEAIGIDSNFFELGGHSLKFAGLIGRIHKKLNIKVPFVKIFKIPTIRELAEYIRKEKEREKEDEKILLMERKEYYRLSSAQRRLFALRQMDTGCTAYNITGTLRVEGKVEKEKFAGIFIHLIRRHESLRTSFHMAEDQPVQKIHDEVDFEIEYYQVEVKAEEKEGTRGLAPLSIPATGKPQSATSTIRNFIRPFDLSQPPLMRVGLIKEEDQKHILIVDMHHIISDGLSMEIFVKDFGVLYNGEDLPLLPVIRYKDYAEWETGKPVQERLKKQKEYWSRQFDGEVPVLMLPTDFSRPVVQDFEGHTLRFELTGEQTQALKAAVFKKKTTLNVVLLTLYTIFLSKITGQEDIVVGIPSLARPHVETETIIGMFANSLALRNFPRGEKSIGEFITEVKARTLEAFANQDYSYENLVENLVKNRDTSRNPLFDTMFVQQEVGVSRVELPDLQVKPYPYETNTSKFDLILYCMQEEDKVWFKFEYSTKLFKRTTVERFIGYFQELIREIPGNSDKKLKEIEILSDKEKHQLLIGFNDTAADYPTGKTIHGLFEAQVERIPNHIAIIGPQVGVGTRFIASDPGKQNVHLTYNQLNEKSNQLASLLKEKGIQAETIVAIMTERSIEMIIGILAILKAGGAYLPIDPEYPRERIRYMLEDSNIKILVKNSNIISVPRVRKDLFVLDFEHLNFEFVSNFAYSCFTISDLNASNIAYIIYTSGTTGKPKGVLIQHQNVVRLLFNDRNLFDFNRDDVWTLFHSYCFDFSVWEMYGALLYGGKLVIIPGMTAKDPGQYWQVLVEEKVTVLNQTPSAFYALSPEALTPTGKKTHLRYVIFGGEALKPLQLNKWAIKYPHVKLINMFGITETTVHVTYKEIGDKEIRLNISNIGKPIPTLTTHILDRNLNLLPIGVAGELCVGGAGVGRGYLNRPGLTAEKFLYFFYRSYKSYMTYIPKKVYKSGDLARWLSNGEMEYLGRIDHQVKIRGFRVELGEIETRLLTYSQVKEAVVITLEEENGDKYLCAYVVPDLSNSPQTPTQLDIPGLRQYLSGTLPGYMIPAYFVELEKIPLTSNGKIDRRNLPEPGEALRIKNRYEAPKNKIQEQMERTWNQVLGLERTSIKDSFFTIGGDSIKAIRLISLLNVQLNTNFKIKDLYAHQSIEELAELVEQSRKGYTGNELNQVEQEITAIKHRIMAKAVESEQIEDTNIEDIYPMSDIEKGLVFYYLKSTGVAVYHDQFIYPLKYREFDINLFKKAMGLLVAKHQILRTSFNVEDFEESVQIVHREVHFEIPYYDIAYMKRSEQEEYIKRYLAEDKQRPFSAAIPPLFRMAVFVPDDENIWVVLVCHHAVLDGWSTASMMTELHNTYLRLRSNTYIELEQLRSSYRDVIVEEIIEKRKSQNREFWLNELAGYKRLEFPRLLKNDESFSGMKTYDYNLGRELLTGLKKTSQNFNISIKDLCFAAYVYMLSILCNESDIVVGCVTHNRPQKQDGDKILGCFLNTVPVRIKIPIPINWSEYIAIITAKVQEIKSYERVSLFEIARIIGEKSQEENPIFDTLFNFVDFHIYFGAAPENGRYQHQGTSSVDISLKGNQDTNTLFDFEISVTFGEFILCPKYNHLTISHDMVQRSCVYFERILKKFIKAPREVVRKDEIIPAEERLKLLEEFNRTTALYNRDGLIHELFEAQVERTPDNIAAAGPTERKSRTDMTYISYRELNKKSNRLAHVLRKKGVKTNTLVGVVIDRSIEMIRAVMGILKAGGAYVPLEPYLPETRTGKLLGALNVKYLVTNHLQLAKICKIVEELPELEHIFCLTTGTSGTLSRELSPGKSLIFPLEIKNASEENPAPLVTSRDMAYIIFTSGSTGTPKGVVVNHQPVINIIEWVNKTFVVGTGDKVLFVSSLGFDLSVYDIFGILASGACSRVVPADDLKEPQALLDTIVKEGITFWDSAPAALQQLVPFLPEIKNYRHSSRFRLVFLSGDWIPVTLPDALRGVFIGLKVISLGGATEATIWSNYYPIEIVDPAWVSIPYGKPIQNAKYYILDPQLNICPIMVPGDLYIGGECLAAGYINEVELTAGKFILATKPQRHKDGYFSWRPGALVAKLYKTGDIARWFEDGNMEFLGRKDQQVKIRGYRIELGEIETQLQHHEDIKEAIVIANGDRPADRYLCAYIVSNKTVDPLELKKYLAKELPDYMVPSYFIGIEQIPLTPNGKIDYKAFSAPVLETGEQYIAPRDKVEKKLAVVWAEILGIGNEIIGIDADFFLLGGHSLKATVLAAKVHKAFDVKLDLAEIFKTPTIRELAAYVRKASPNKYVSINPASEKEYYTASSAQVSLYFIQQMELEGTSYNLPMSALLEGQLDLKKFENVFVKLIQRHESLRSSFEMINEELVQKIHKKTGFKIENYDASQVEDVFKHFIRPFDLAKAPLMRVGLLKQEVEKHILMLDFHHIIADGASIDLLVRELAALYAGEELPRLKFQYRDYAEWQKKEKENGSLNKQEAYWLKQFDGKIPVLNLPVDYLRPPVRDFEGDRISFEISRADTEALKKRAIEEGATMYMVLLAIYSILLAKICSQEDIVIGVTPAGRRYVDLESIVGVFPNALGIRVFPSKEKNFSAFLRGLRDTVLKSLENQEYQFDDLVEKVVMERDPGRNPLFDVFFMLGGGGFQELDIPGLKAKPYGLENKNSKYDLELNAWESDGRVVFSIVYKINLFKKDTIKLFQDYLTRIISIIQNNQMIKLSEIEMTSHLEEESQFTDDLEG